MQDKIFIRIAKPLTMSQRDVNLSSSKNGSNGIEDIKPYENFQIAIVNNKPVSEMRLYFSVLKKAYKLFI